MASVNKVIIVGKLGRDPEMRQTPSGSAVCTLSLATTETWSDNGNKQERTEWHRIIVWGKQADNCAKYLSKGKGVFVEGRLQTRSWDDKDGQKRYATEIVAQSVQFLGGGQRSDAPETEKAAEEINNFTHNSSLDDIPF